MAGCGVLAWLSRTFGPAEPAYGPRIAVAVVLVLLCVGYLLACRWCGRVRPWTVVALATLMRLPMLWSQPIQEVDAYRYLWDGWVQTRGVNPYRHPPAAEASAALAADAPGMRQVLERVHFPRIRTVYPPTSQLFFRVVVSGDRQATPAGQLLRLRLGLLACEGLLWWAVLGLLRTLRLPVGRLLWVAWCPLAVKEIANSAHIDVLPALLVTLATWAAVSRGRRPALQDKLPQGRPASPHRPHRLQGACRPEAGCRGAVGKPRFPLSFWGRVVVRVHFDRSEDRKSHPPSGHILPRGKGVGHVVSRRIEARDRSARGRRHRFPSRSWVRNVAGAVLLGLAVAAKAYPLVVAPPLLAWLGGRTGRRWWATTLATLLCMGTVAATCLPYVDGTRASWNRLSEGMRTFAGAWEMNDLLFMVVHQNLEPDWSGRPPVWFCVVPDSWRRVAIQTARPWLPAAAGPLATPPEHHLARAVVGLIGSAVLLFLWVRLARRPTRRRLVRTLFLSVTWLWLLCPTQNPWYLLWTLPLLPVVDWPGWRWLPCLALVYYLRFALAAWFPNAVPGTPYDGERLFDLVVVWLEFGLWLLWLAWSGAAALREKT